MSRPRVQSVCTLRSVEDEPTRISRNIEIKTRLLGEHDDTFFTNDIGNAVFQWRSDFELCNRS